MYRYLHGALSFVEEDSIVSPCGACAYAGQPRGVNHRTGAYAARDRIIMSGRNSATAKAGIAARAN